MTPWVLYGQKGAGSIAVEAALTPQAIPYTLCETPPRGPAASEAFGIGGIVRRVDADPRLTALWADRFAFVPGREG